MSIAITLYKVNKKRNSSKLPAVSDVYLNVSGNFVEDSSFFNPTVILSRDVVVNVAKFNYFGISWPDDIVATRYYWVNDKVIQKDGCLRLSGTEDCYATFRTKISNSSFYVKRSDYSYRGELPDTSFSIGSEPKNIYYERLLDVDDLENQIIHTPYVRDGSGLYVVGVSAPETIDGSHITPADTSEFKRGGVKYYTFNPSDMYDFIKALERIQVGHGADYKLTDFIVSCMYLPIDITCFGLEWASDTKNTYFMLSYNEDTNEGYWVSITNRHYISTNVHLSNTGAVQVDKLIEPKDANNNYLTHPQYSSYGKMANAQPFVKISLTDAMVGTIDLPTYPLSNVVKYHVEYILDLITGYISITCCPMEVPISHHSVSSSIGIPIALSAISTDSYVNRKIAQTARNKTTATSMIGVAGATAAGALSGGFVGAAVGAVGGIANMIVQGVVAKDQYDVAIYQNSRFESDVIGNNGTLCIADLGISPYIAYRYYDIVDTTNFVVHPRIVNKYIAGSSLYTNSAFAICENAQLSDNTGLTYGEESAICEQLNSGFFFE